MSLPKDPEVQDQQWEGVVRIEKISHHAEYGDSYAVKIEGDSVWLKLRKNVPGMVGGQSYSVKISRKIGTKTWFVYSAMPVDSVSENTLKGVQTETAVKPEVKQTYAKKESYEDGQNKGNYRTNLTSYIIHCIDKDITPDIKKFNTMLIEGENDMFSIEPRQETVTKIDELF